MKKTLILTLVFLAGILCTVYYLNRKNHTEISTQTLLRNIEHASKLVVAEGNFSHIYTYKDSKKYFGDLIKFDKKAVLLINAKAIVSYDMKKLKIQTESDKKTIIIQEVPTAEIQIIPDIKYYDLMDSSFNRFEGTDLNKVREKALEELRKEVTHSGLKKQARERLSIELGKIYLLSKIYGWKIIDKAEILTSLEL